jgi:Carboxypeptidase regulatory-like domain
MSSSRRLLSLFTAFALTFVTLVPLSAPAAMAQATTGEIRGSVVDPGGAAIVDATVRARNQGTNVETAVFKTTGEGTYSIPNLIPGLYTLTVEASGFRRSQTTDVNVNIGQVTPIDVQLQTGGLEETVTVVANTEEVVNRDQSQISTTFETRKVEDLPTNAVGAGLDTLALLAPGVIPSSGFGGTNTNGTGLSVNGNRTRSNNFQIDGSDNNDLSVGGPSFFVGNMDQVAEYQVITNNFSAQYGRNQGAIVNIVTKSGTNDFHGTGYIFHRDRRALDTLTNIERAGGAEEAPRFLSNVYGGSFGGPIKRDRAFFFGTYQGIKQREGFISRSGSLAILPSEFPRLLSLYPNNPAIAAIATSSAFAITNFGNVRQRTDPGFNTTDTICLPAASGSGTNCFQAAFPEREFAVPFDQNEFSIRGDVKVTDRDNFYARYLYQDGSTGNALGSSNGFTGDIPFTSRNLGGTYLRQIGSKAVNEFRATYQKLFVDFGGGCDESNVAGGCIPASQNIANTFTNITFPSVVGTANPTVTLQTIGGATNLPQGRTTDLTQFADNFSITMGRHSLIIGGEVKYTSASVPFLPNFQGVYRFATQGGVSGAQRLVNNTTQRLTLAVGDPIINYTEWDQYYFIQDDFKIRENLTLNLGLRYEYTGQPINDLADLTLAREQTDARLFNPALPLEQRVLPRIEPDKNNFAPRVGFAWSPRFGSDGFFGRLFGETATVIRGGYSIAYDPAFYNILLNVSNTAPVNIALQANNLPGGATAAGRFGVVQNPIASEVQAAASAAGLLPVGQLNPIWLTRSGVADDFHAPYSQQFSLGIQRQINRNNVFEIRYVGTRGVGLFQTVDRNPFVGTLVNGFTLFGETFPNFQNLLPSGVTPQVCADVAGTPDNEGACNGRLLRRGIFTTRDNSARSSYDSMQTRYTGRLFRDLSIGAAYTFSKTLDNASEVFAFSENSSLAPNPFDVGRAEKSFSALHRPHAFSMNFIYDVPFLKSQEGAVGRLLGGWQINSTYVLATGRPFTPSQFIHQSFFGLGASYLTNTGETARPFYGNPDAPATSVGITDVDVRLFLRALGFSAADVAGLVSPTGFYSFNDFNTDFEFNPVTPNDVRFIFNGAGAARRFGTPFGDVPRNSERGPRLNQLNMGFFKNTKVRENFTVQFRAEFFNILNHPNPGYGVSAGDSLPASIYVDDAGSFFNRRDLMELNRRVVQFGLRLVF